MAFDAHKNLAISTVVTPPAPATSGTLVGITAGEGGRFPAPPFTATVWPASQPPTPANAELVRVTARTSDSLTITRAAEGSIARSIVAGDLIAATITAKVITDIEAGTNFPLITTPGDITMGSGGMIAAHQVFTLSGSGAAGYGAVAKFRQNGMDFGYFGRHAALLGGSSNSLLFQGATPDGLSLMAVDAAGAIKLHTGGVTERGRIHPSGGFSWGATTDPGAGAISVTPAAPGTPGLTVSLPGTGQTFAAQFANANGQTGYIGVLGTTTTYATTSDQRLKTDRGLITDPEVLRSTRVHHFTWNTDGTTGRGVFAQEAIAVLPSAVSIGTDERDEQGNLTQPWGVDYSKYVPDLIVGWQEHDSRFDQMAARVAFLEGAITALRNEPRPSLYQRIVTAIRAWWAAPKAATS